ncbi:MAG TPA: hypothetical protein VLQ65_09785 [Saliniramus sp.]|nr:hypothetical protein [Saliniramus sp.]
MDRLLGPNETKFWLLDLTAPMNLVVVARLGARPPIEALTQSGTFLLPLSKLGPHDRPRWGSRSADGVVEVISGSRREDWLPQAERLLQVRVGTQGHPPFHAVLLEHGEGATLLLALSHALFDYRSALMAVEAFLAGHDPGAPMPACEELLPTGAYSDEDADDLIDYWWRRDAGIRWEAAGLARLAAALPPATPTRLASSGLTRDDAEALERRCREEGVSLANALAVAASSASGETAVAFAIDMARFIDPPPSGPGLAISHLTAEVPPGNFWEAARAVRRQLREGIEAGLAGDRLLDLPRALRQGGLDGIARSAAVTVTGAPRPAQAAAGAESCTARWVVSSARGGGFVINPVRSDQGIELLASLETSDDPALHDEIRARLLRAV